MRVSTKLSTQSPWWLGGGTEFCECCGQSHAYPAHKRCEGCDAVLCIACIDAEYKAVVLCEHCKKSARLSKRARR